MIGAVTMKMTSSTSMTSTSGVTLICAIVVPSRWEEASIAITTSGTLLFEEVALSDIQELMGKVIHFHRQHLDMLHKIIIRQQRGNSSCQADRRGDQGLGDARRHGLDARRVGDAQTHEGIHDPPNGAE